MLSKEGTWKYIDFLILYLLLTDESMERFGHHVSFLLAHSEAKRCIWMPCRLHTFLHHFLQSQIILPDGMCHLQLQGRVSSHRPTRRGFALEPTVNLCPFCSPSSHSSSFHYEWQNLEIFSPKHPAADMSDMAHQSRNMLTGGIHVTDPSS